MIEIIGAPFDLCGMRPGSRLGPAALRLAGIQEAITALSLDVVDAGDVETQNVCPTGEGLRDFQALIAIVSRLKKKVDHVLAPGNLPIVIGGEHTLAVAGISSALNRIGETLGLLWIDAHADANTPGSSQTGNIHGMPLAALARLPSGVDGAIDADWKELLVALEPGPGLRLENVVWYGLRDVDEGEKPQLRGLPITMHDIDRHGVEGTIRRADEWFRRRGVTHVWVSFDVDALDPFLAPGTGTAVRGGLTYREAHFMAELFHETLIQETCTYSLLGLDIVETNPITDTMNQTAVVAVEWAASLFGKTIL